MKELRRNINMDDAMAIGIFPMQKIVATDMTKEVMMDVGSIGSKDRQ